MIVYRGLKAIRTLALVVWVGGLTLFAFVLAPVAFRVLPSTHEAGLVVGAALRLLHLIGLVAGLVYIAASVAAAAGESKAGRRWWLGPGLVAGMMLLTGISQGSILPRMEVDRAAAGGDVTADAQRDPARVDFDRLHRLSERVEGGVVLLGLGATVLLAIEDEARRV